MNHNIPCVIKIADGANATCINPRHVVMWHWNAPNKSVCITMLGVPSPRVFHDPERVIDKQLAALFIPAVSVDELTGTDWEA